jgi:hypothetical protein
MCEFVFKFGNTGLVDVLVCPGGLIFRIFSQVGIVSNRLLDPLNKARSLDPYAMLNSSSRAA